MLIVVKVARRRTRKSSLTSDREAAGNVSSPLQLASFLADHC
jgi:hypothetical protein